MTEVLTIRLARSEKRAVQKLAGKSGASRWVRSLIRANIGAPSAKGFVARHEKWLAEHGEMVDGEAVLDWFRRNRR